MPWLPTVQASFHVSRRLSLLIFDQRKLAKKPFYRNDNSTPVTLPHSKDCIPSFDRGFNAWALHSLSTASKSATSVRYRRLSKTQENDGMLKLYATFGAIKDRDSKFWLSSNLLSICATNFSVKKLWQCVKKI